MAEEDDDGLSERAAQSTQPEDEDSAGDDDFLANLEELPDTDELEEDDVQGEDSDEQPYEAESAYAMLTAIKAFANVRIYI